MIDINVENLKDNSPPLKIDLNINSTSREKNDRDNRLSKTLELEAEANLNMKWLVKSKYQISKLYCR